MDSLQYTHYGTVRTQTDRLARVVRDHPNVFGLGRKAGGVGKGGWGGGR